GPERLSTAPDEVRFFYDGERQRQRDRAARRPQRGRAPRSPQGEARVHGGGDQPRDHTQDGVRRDAPQERGQDRDRATHGGRVAKPPPLTQPSPLRREGSRCIGGDSMYDTSLW